MYSILLIIPSIKEVGGASTLALNLLKILEDEYLVKIVTFERKYHNLPISYENIICLDPVNEKLPLIFRIFQYLRLAYDLNLIKRRLKTDISISILWRADLINHISKNKEKTISISVINIKNNSENSKIFKMRFFVGFIYRSFNYIATLNSNLRKEFINLFNIDKSKINVLKPIVEYKFPKSAENFRINRYVCCSRIVKEKNIQGLLFLWKNFLNEVNLFQNDELSFKEKPQLVIIGDGPEYELCKSIASKLNLKIGYKITDNKSDVIFTGFISNPQDLINGSRAFLLTSKSEGTPYVIFIAAFLKVPLLIANSNGGGCKEILEVPVTEDPKYEENIQNGKFGLLLPIPDSSKKVSINTWVKALKRIHFDDEFYNSCSKKAFNLYLENSPKVIKHQWEQIIKEILKNSK